MALIISRVDRLAEILLDQNLKYEVFDVSFGRLEEANEVMAAVERLGFRSELDPYQSRIRIFRDTLARAEAVATGEVFQIALRLGDGGFLSD